MNIKTKFSTLILIMTLLIGYTTPTEIKAVQVNLLDDQTISQIHQLLKSAAFYSISCAAACCGIFLMKKGIEKAINGNTQKNNNDQAARKKGLAFLAVGGTILVGSAATILKNERIVTALTQK